MGRGALPLLPIPVTVVPASPGAVLLVGASGFIGRNLLPALSRLGVPVTATYRSAVDFPEFCARHAPNARPLRVDLEHGDLAPVAGRWGTCLHLAAHVRLAETAADLATDLAKNVTPLVRLLNALEADRFVYLSSGSVYEGSVGEVSPGTPVAPSLPYSVSKLTGEAAVRFARVRRGSIGSYTILRFFGAFGPWEPPFKIYTRAVRAALEGTELPGYGDGSNLIDALPSAAAVDALMCVVQAEGLDDEVLDLSMGMPLTIRECVAEVGQVLGREVTSAFTGTSPEDIRYTARPDEFAARFGWGGPPASRAEGIERLAAWVSVRAGPA